jgi:hypothetical protein
MESEGIFDFMGKKELTSLKFLYIWRLDTFLMRGMARYTVYIDISG